MGRHGRDDRHFAACVRSRAASSWTGNSATTARKLLLLQRPDPDRSRPGLPSRRCSHRAHVDGDHRPGDDRHVGGDQQREWHRHLGRHPAGGFRRETQRPQIRRPGPHRQAGRRCVHRDAPGTTREQPELSSGLSLLRRPLLCHPRRHDDGGNHRKLAIFRRGPLEQHAQGLGSEVSVARRRVRDGAPVRSTPG